MTIYDRMQIPLETIMNDVEHMLVEVLPRQQPSIESEHIISQIAELYNLIKEKDVFLHKYWVPLFCFPIFKRHLTPFHRSNYRNE